MPYPSRGSVPLLLVCALNEEIDSLTDSITSLTELKGEPLGDGSVVLWGPDGAEVAVMAVFEGTGNSLSYAITEKLISRYKPNLAVLFGIAAGIPNNAGVGDVIVAKSVWDMRKSAITQRGKQRSFEFEPSQLDSLPKQRLPFSVRGLRDRLASTADSGVRVHDDLLCGSSDHKVRDDEYMEAASNTHRKLGCLEMEGAGFAEACRKARTPFLVIKAVSDHGEPEHDDEHHILACDRCAKVLLLAFLPGHVKATELPQPPANPKLLRALDSTPQTGFPRLWTGVATADTNWANVSDFEPLGLIVRASYGPYSASLPEPCRAIYREHLRAREMAELENRDYPFNGSRYRVLSCSVGDRRTRDERAIARITFADSDYFSFLATSQVLDRKMVWPGDVTQTLRERFLADAASSPQNVVGFLANSFGLNLLVITADRKALIVQRSGFVALRRGIYHISVNEGLRRSDGGKLFDQKSRHNACPNIGKAARRGLWEEMGIRISPKDARTIRWTSLGLDPIGYQFGLLGYVKLSYNSEDILRRAEIARDKTLEVKHVFPIDFEPCALLDFVDKNQPWVAWGLECIYQALLSERTPRSKEYERTVDAFSNLRATTIGRPQCTQ
ncbi:MAG: hypothetical protein JXA57_13875 [Armatimonadetes bacterium]|nr:hypothetical protein [Armatimonadota bacterium]